MASLYLLQGLNYIVPMAVLPYLVRVLGMEMYGLLATAQSFSSYFIVLTDYGFNYSATRSIAQNKNDSLAVSRISSSVFAVKLMLTVVGAIILSAIMAFAPTLRHNATYFYVAYIAVVGNLIFPYWYFQGIEQMRYIAILNGCTRVAAAIALFIFVHRRQDALLALAILSSGILLSGILASLLLFVHFRLRLVVPAPREIYFVLKDGWHLFVSTAALGVYTNTNVFLVGLLAGNVEAGYFSAADKIVRAINGLIMPVSSALFPHVSTLVQESRERALRFARKTLQYMVPLMLVPSVALLIFAGTLVHIYLGANAVGSIPVIRLIGLLPVVIAISNVLGVQTMVPFGLDKQYSRILVLGGALNTGLAIILIKLYGATGAGIAVITTEILVAIAIFLSLERFGISVLQPERVK